MSGRNQRDADPIRRHASRGTDPACDRALRGSIELPALRSSRIRVCNPRPESFFRGSCHHDDNERLQHPFGGGIEPVGVSMASEGRLDRLFEDRIAVGAVGDIGDRQSDRADILALGPFREARRPGFDLLRDGLAIGQHASVMGFERNIFAQDILAGRRRPGHTARIGYHLDDRGLIATGQHPCPGESMVLAETASDRCCCSRSLNCGRPAPSAFRARRQSALALRILSARDRLSPDRFVSAGCSGLDHRQRSAAPELILEDGSPRPAPIRARLRDAVPCRGGPLCPPGDMIGSVHDVSRCGAS